MTFLSKSTNLPSLNCHSEQSSRFAKRSSYLVEGPLHLRNFQQSVKAFSPRCLFPANAQHLRSACCALDGLFPQHVNPLAWRLFFYGVSLNTTPYP